MDDVTRDFVIVASILGGILALAFVVFTLYAYIKTRSGKRALVTFFAALTITYVILGSLWPGLSRIIMFSIAVGIMGIHTFGIIIFLNLPLNTQNNPHPAIKLLFGNPVKGFGGVMFGDIANSVGVLAGVGASQVFDSQVFWWIGQYGALFAIGISLSTLWSAFALKNEAYRLHGTLPNMQHGVLNHGDQAAIRASQEYKDSRPKMWAAFLNLFVGVATWVSLVWTDTINWSEAGLPFVGKMWFGISLVVVLTLLAIIIAWSAPLDIRVENLFRKSVWLDFGWDLFYLICMTIAALFLLGNSIALGFFPNSINPTINAMTQAPTNPGTQNNESCNCDGGVVVQVSPPTGEEQRNAKMSASIGFLGVIAWIVVELISWVTLSGQFLSTPVANIRMRDYLIWEKNVWEIVGGVALLIYLGAVFADAVNPTRSAKVADLEAIRIIFITGAILALLGTLRGVLGGVLRRF